MMSQLNSVPNMHAFYEVTNTSTDSFFMVLRNVTTTPLGVSGGGGVTHNVALDVNGRTASVEEQIVYVLEEVLIPIIAALGMLGNGLNVLVLWWRYRQRDIDIMERGALLGLIALAVSDMAFCFVLFPKSLLPSSTVFTSYGAHLSYQLYGLYFQNVFIKTSTWLTLVVGFARYSGICHPLRARMCIRLPGIGTAIIVTYMFWFLVESPLIWTYQVKQYQMGNVTYFFIDVGAFAEDEILSEVFTYLWAILGYFVPVLVLIYCNGCLIHALRQSHKMRREACIMQGQSSLQSASTRITLTLIVLIVMFVVLVSPSEMIHFFELTTGAHGLQYFKIGIITTNVLQAVNFAFSFVLYCFVNATFRRTVVGWVTCLTCGRVTCKRATSGGSTNDMMPNQQVAPSSSSGGSSCSGSIQTRTYYCALKHSVIHNQKSAEDRTYTTRTSGHISWTETSTDTSTR